MKRLIAVICTFVILFSQGILFPQSATAAGSAKALDANALIGMTNQELTAKYGAPDRTEPSEYGFTWSIYNRDYTSFMMVGIREDKVVAIYTNIKALNYKKQFVFGSSKAAVRAKLGSPITYVRSGNTICILNNTDQKDIFPVNGNYVMVFYDKTIGTKVTSILILPQSDEDNAFITLPVLTDNLVAAYQRISVDLINAVRVRSGLKKLVTDSKNTKLAVSRSKDMRDRNYFDHYTPAPRLSPLDQARRMGIKYSSFGENIAFGDHNAILAHEAFMNSPGHRSNVLKANYTKVGAGVAYGGNRYVLLTNIFTR